MFTSNIKRSVATLGVVAGLLAAAVPATAGPVGVPANMPNDALTLKAGASEVLYETVTVKAPKPSDADRTLTTNGSADDNMYYLPDVNDEVLAVKAPTKAEPASMQLGAADRVATSEVFELNTFGGNDTLSAQGTQVGSEGVKAPTKEQPSTVQNDREAHVPLWG